MSRPKAPPKSDKSSSSDRPTDERLKALEMENIYLQEGGGWMSPVEFRLKQQAT